MQRPAAICLFALFLLLSSTAFAQVCEVNITTSPEDFCRGDMVTLSADPASVMLTNPADSLNFHRGVMFDLQALQTIVIEDFYVRPKLLTNIEVYYKIGSYDGWENTPSVWTLIGSVFNIPGAMDPVPLGLSLDLEIPAGQTYGFYITSTDPTISMYYNNGMGEGTYVIGDAQLSLISGGGLEYPFGGTAGGVFEPRDFYGTIKYKANADFTWSDGTTAPALTVPADGSTYGLSASFPDYGCTAEDSITLVGNPAQVLPAVAYLCTGVDLELAAGPDDPAFTYNWSNGETTSSITLLAAGLTAGESIDLTVAIDDGAGCSATDAVSIHVLDPPAIDLPGELFYCLGHPASIDAGGGPGFSYMWNTGATTQTLDLLTAGLVDGFNTISVMVQSPEGCENSKAILIEARVCTGLNSIEEGITIYPNPANSWLQIDGLTPAAQPWQIVDMQGRTVSSGVLTESAIGLSLLAKGIYLLEIEMDGKLLRKRFLKN